MARIVRLAGMSSAAAAAATASVVSSCRLLGLAGLATGRLGVGTASELFLVEFIGIFSAPLLVDLFTWLIVLA